ncbi:MAG: DUF420 domain-containing protein [Flavisolibacter sp.]
MNLFLYKNDRKARWIIFSFSFIVFMAVTAMERVKLDLHLSFNPHALALVNALINSAVAVLLLVGLFAAKSRRLVLHRKIMLSAIALSLVFLFTYILHHLLAGSTLYGDLDHNHVVDEMEKAKAGSLRYVYFFLLGTHILLAGISLPYILFTAYRALINENMAHRKLAKITWPLWLYVSVTGPLVYLLIRPYY